MLQRGSVGRASTPAAGLQTRPFFRALGARGLPDPLFRALLL